MHADNLELVSDFLRGMKKHGEAAAALPAYPVGKDPRHA